MNTQIDLDRVALVAREEWASDAQLRDEFLNDEESFLAYRRAEAMGIARHCGPGHTPEREVTAATAMTSQKPDVDPNWPVEDRCKAEWQHDPQLRAEFDSVEDYIAYATANERGLVRVREGVTNDGR